MEVCLMIEGQEDVTWEDWQAIAAACEEHGVGTLFRSDHYLSVDDRRERGSLDAWTTIAALAAVTETLRLGTLVSPATFRHPAVLAKSVVTADHVSGGRVELGIGAGWWDREHEAFGIDLPPVGPRLDALEEQLELIGRYWGEGPFNYEGRHYTAVNLDALPKPVQKPRPPLILGGSGGPRSLRLAAAFADEYNTVMSTVAEIADVRERLDQACEAADRDPASLPLSMMTGWLVGADRDDLRNRAARLARWKGQEESGAAFLEGVRESTIAGTVPEAVGQLQALEDAGLARIMGQHLLHRDLDAIELMGQEVIPALGSVD
ncbi:MAG TPA: TIGR03560 family F420-dependent LLM class oxidoreductase [Solirubrobacterales bacterium]|jgi:F420-dependent oxidoreductase-like protein|nr:TIGR03560 family F420-dependent LLM class oxidoreductase [Solirubrobacterales bacterium]